MMITSQKPGDLGSKKFSCRFGDLKLKKLEIWGFRDPPQENIDIVHKIFNDIFEKVLENHKFKKTKLPCNKCDNCYCHICHNFIC